MKPTCRDANLRGLYFDLAGTPSADAVRQLLKITDTSHNLYGSDYPCQADGVLLNAIEFLKRDLDSDPQLAPLADDILSENAGRLSAQGRRSKVF